MKRIFIAGLLLLSAFSVFAQKKVTPLPLDSGFQFKQNYFFYALPQTAFKVNVAVARTHEMAGIYADYAEKLLGLTNVITQDKIVYSLKSIEIEQIAIPDTHHLYVVELSPKQMKNDLFTEICLKQSAAGRNAETYTYQRNNLAIPDFFRYYSDLAYMEQENSYVETQIIDGVVRQVPATKVQKVPKSNEQQAQEAADMIAKIREDRYALLTGAQEVSYSADALDRMLAQLDEMERNYIALFTGFEIEEIENHTVVVVPANESTFAFSISPKAGFSTVAAGNNNDNYTVVLQPVDYASSCTDFTTQLGCAKSYKPKDGYRIRLANPAKVLVNQGSKTVYSIEMAPIYQLGKIETLSRGHDELDIEKFGLIY